MLLIMNVMVNFSLSKWSSLRAAFLRYFYENVNKSQILYMVDLGSNILIGSDVCDIDSPFSMFTASYLITCERIPFYFSSYSSSVYIRPPLSGYAKWLRSSSLSVERMNFVNMNSLSKYFGGGANLLYGYLESTKDLLPTESVVESKKALFLISSSSGKSI